jgi:SAM-dependent methyltransferase
MTVFGLYARYYDLLYRQKDYGAEAQYVVANLPALHAGTCSIFEMGCGTGAHAQALAQMGYSVAGIDVSEAMLQRAQQRCDALPQAERRKMSFTAGDVRTYRCGQSFDAVLSLFHVMSYQVSNEDLDAAFATAAAHMHDDSVFLFDFWYGPAVLSTRPETRVRRLENESIRVMRLAEPLLRENENCVDVNYTVLIEDKRSAAREELHETHTMRYLFLPEIDAFLHRAGLQRIKASTWLSDKALDAQAWSGFVACRKLGPARTLRAPG